MDIKRVLDDGMSYPEFLDTVKVLKMLYGRDIAEIFFTKNNNLYYDTNSASIFAKKEI